MLLTTACGSTTEPITAGSILVSPAVDTLPAGAQRQLTARLVRSPGDTVPALGVIWSSGDPDIALVSDQGMVTAMRSGRATITALVADEQGTAVVQVERRFTASAVAVGPQEVCALDMQGQAWCFGNNSSGELGLGYSGDRIPTFTAPVSDGHTFRAIGVGTSHVCALDTGGQAWCWGSNYGNELGHRATYPYYSLRPVAVDPLKTWDALAVGPGGESCGLVAGIPWCWGGGYVVLSRPRQDASATFASLAIGTYTTCGLASDGQASCWYSFDGAPSTPSFDGAVTQVAVGGQHLCAIFAGGVAQCRGLNASGQLGDGTRNDAPSPVVVAGSHQWTLIATGDTSTCGLAGDGAAYCWGANGSGQLGTGDSLDVSVPTPVAGGLRFRSIATSGASNSGSLTHQTCAITMSDELYCWGSGRPPRPTPVVY